MSKASDKSWVLSEVGFCHMRLGRLETAVPFYERAAKQLVELEDWRSASRCYQNLAELNTNLGRLAASVAAAEQALALARRAANKQDERNSLARVGLAAHLAGQLEDAWQAFNQAEKLEHEISDQQYRYSIDGIWHAEHLRRVGEAAYARRVTAANLEIVRGRSIKDISMCHRILGELDAADGQTTAARAHFDEALAIARGISDRAVLIEALLARGRWAARLAVGARRALPLQQAFSDLNEALGYAADGGYRIYEADIRIALGWAHLAAGESAITREEAARAQTMSQAMSYHWGQVDAAELLAAIDEG